MTKLYPIVLETEDNGAVSTYVPGLPVYAAADSHATAERVIRDLPHIRSYRFANGRLAMALMADGGIYIWERMPS